MRITWEAPGVPRVRDRLLSWVRDVEVLGRGTGRVDEQWVELQVVDTYRWGKARRRAYRGLRRMPLHPNSRCAPISQPFGPPSGYEDYRPHGYWSTGSTGPVP